VPNGATFTGILNQPNKISVNYGSSSISGIVSVKAGCGTNVGNASTLPITVNPWPSGAQAFSGPSSICIGQTSQAGVIYNVPIIANATSYQWTLPSGVICTNGCTTNIITVAYGTTAVSGNITVKGVNSCGAGSAYSMAVNVNNTTPITSGTISGTASVCWGDNGVIYTIPAISNASSYEWILPNGATGNSSTNSINVNYAFGSDSGNITVRPVNGCGVGTTVSIPINVNALSPNTGAISGSSVVCVGQNNVIYSTPPITYANTYEWTLPSGATGISTTNSIVLSYGSAAVSGNIKVRGRNGCGVGNNASLAINVGVPSNLGSITGSTTVFVAQNDVIYTVPSIANATSYIWTLPNGATGSSISNSISVNYGTSAVNGNITVKGTNNCGDGTPSILAVTVCNIPPPSAGNGVIDIDGNTYNSIIIGTQEWQKENLNVSKYSDGTPIPQITDLTQWMNASTGAWCWLYNNSVYGAVYGKLYNWYAVAGIYNYESLVNPSLRKNLAPDGWHVATDQEWSTMINNIDQNANGGSNISNVAGGKMKETGTIHWASPNTDASNSSGFSGLPGGKRDSGNFSGDTVDGFWYSSTENNTACLRSLSTYVNYVVRFFLGPSTGASVRCIKGITFGINDFSKNSIKLFPNPANSIINLAINDGIILNKITIVDVTGKVLLEQTENLSSIDVDKLAKGVYILTAYDGEKKCQEKFIKE
jgi:uncharacterized protein (TIGR02145 family)